MLLTKWNFPYISSLTHSRSGIFSRVTSKNNDFILRLRRINLLNPPTLGPVHTYPAFLFSFENEIFPNVFAFCFQKNRVYTSFLPVHTISVSVSTENAYVICRHFVYSRGVDYVQGIFRNLFFLSLFFIWVWEMWCDMYISLVWLRNLTERFFFLS